MNNFLGERFYFYLMHNNIAYSIAQSIAQSIA